MKKVLSVICAAVVLAGLCFGAVYAAQALSDSRTEKTESLTLSQDKLAVSVSVLYKRAGELVVSLPYASINLSQTALMKTYSGEQNDALMYLNTHADKELNNAYAAMDEILKDFDTVLKAYSSASGSYSTKRAELEQIFGGLESACTELIRRTRTLIAGTDSSYDSYYTSYCEQLVVVSDRLEAAATTIGNEYDTVMKTLLGNDYSAIS